MAWPIRLTWSCGACPTRLIRAHTAMRVPPRSASGTFRASDGWINIGGANQANWERIAEVLGHPEWSGDPRFATNEDRNANEGFINQIITEWTREHTKEEAMQIIGAAGVPAGATAVTRSGPAR